MNDKFAILIGILAALFVLVYDKTVLELVSLIRFGALTKLMVLISPNIVILGIDVSIFIFIVLVIYSFLLKKRKEILLLWLTIIGTYAVSSILKILFRVVRPVGLIEATSYSFPSSHAAVMFSAFAIMSLRFKKAKWVFLVLALLVAFSRLYLGVHYLSDLLFGGLLGYGIGWIMDKKWK